MVDFKKLMDKPPMTEDERQRLWDDWYNSLPPSEKDEVDKQRRRL